MTLNNRGEMVCVWSGLIGIGIFMVAWVFCLDWFFPPPPSLDAGQIARMYQDNLLGTRTGVALIANFAAPLFVVFAAVITIYMLRMQGPSPALAWINVSAAAIQVLLFVIPAEIFGATAFRPDRSPEITQFGNDLGWIPFDHVVGPTQIQWLAVGFAILWDRSPRPILPRWFAFFNFWCATIMTVNNMILFFKTGPFAWNGLLGWWPAAGTFCTWYVVGFFVMRGAVLRSNVETSH